MYAYCLILLFLCATNCDADYKYETKYITVPIDHFSFATNATFKLRYLYNNTFWTNGGPVFFYTGNEGDINVFAQNTGFMWEIAPNFNALIIFAEHRYYGESLPFGNNSFSDPAHFGYLTSTQALADYVYLIDEIQADLIPKNKGRKSAVIAFGGSYGGMLAAWIRLKYPASVDGALASSAPIYQFSGLTNCSTFNDLLVKVYKLSGPNCVKNVKNSWKAIRNISSGDDGKTWLSSTFKLCNTLKTTQDVDKLTGWLDDVYSNLAMVNYPYPTNFLAPLPAYPVKEFCDKLQNSNITGKPLLQALSSALSVYTNYTGKTKCVNLEESSANVGEAVWNYQACTEMIMPMCTLDNEMYEKSKWNFTSYSQSCFKSFGVRVNRDDLAIMEYGGRDVQYTNLIFTNGLLDPWAGGGFLHSTKYAYAILIPDAAHHLELRASNPDDPALITTTRDLIKKIIYYWLRDI